MVCSRDRKLVALGRRASLSLLETSKLHWSLWPERSVQHRSKRSTTKVTQGMDAHVRLRNLIWSLACALRVNIWFLLGMHKGKVHINETLILIGDGAIKVHSTTLVCSCFREKISNFILPRSPLIRHHQRSDSTCRIRKMWPFHIAVLYGYLFKRRTFDIDISATFDA